MGSTADDRLAMYEVIALHGHLSDAGSHERFDEVFTPDLVVDATALGPAPLPAQDPTRPHLDIYVAAGHRHGPDSPLAHHVTNIIVREDGDGARAWPKASPCTRTVPLPASPTRISSSAQVVSIDLRSRARRRRPRSRRAGPHGRGQ
ncbi:nuclear transport factor 2 family protein [Streptomyces sp. NPDC051578]|uniref:nuclear transport factor 2 family protein n=1 Tax=Streptomyces sp. NPDC051578 TaxID=3365662 RepID=UPI0037BA57F1